MDARGGQSLPVADLDRRFYAQVVDQLLGALAIAAGIALAAPLDGWPMRLPAHSIDSHTIAGESSDEPCS